MFSLWFGNPDSTDLQCEMNPRDSARGMKILTLYVPLRVGLFHQLLINSIAKCDEATFISSVRSPCASPPAAIVFNISCDIGLIVYAENSVSAGIALISGTMSRSCTTSSHAWNVSIAQEERSMNRKNSFCGHRIIRLNLIVFNAGVTRTAKNGLMCVVDRISSVCREFSVM